MKTTLTEEQIKLRDEVFARFDEELPEPYAALAKLRYDPEYASSHKDISNIIDTSFYWDSTQEGHRFWHAVHNYFRRWSRELPPIPEASLSELRKTTMNQPYTLSEQQIKNSTKAQLAESLATAFGDVHRLSVRVNELDEENKRIREHNAMLKSNIEFSDDCESRILDLENRLAEAERERDNLRAECNRLIIETGDLKRSLDSSEETNSILINTLQGARYQFRELQRVCFSLERIL